jgi:hypothetical protein
MCANLGFLLTWDWEAETAGVWCFLGSFFFFFDRVSWVVGRKCGGVERGRREKPLRMARLPVGRNRKERGSYIFAPGLNFRVFFKNGTAAVGLNSICDVSTVCKFY